jgi:single-stranded-DNA-specific exonuclease
VIWGDFDADGQTATALLLDTLRSLSAKVEFHIPSRQEGHGLHSRSLERLVSDGARCILTCDTGVTAHAAVARARDLGAEVIITDHHTPADTLPPALATINPHRLQEGHPLEPLAGVGVAYQLASALDPELGKCGLDLVALGTIADVAALTGDNRYLVQRGLEALRRTERVGLKAIYQAASLRSEGLTEEHIGFILGPRLNALGRLADATRGVQLLTTDDPLRARTWASEMEGLNARRKWLTKQVTDAALAQIEYDPAVLSDYHALVLSNPSWPGGIIGIVAGRLAERFGKPVALITTSEGKLARGSARSSPGVNLIGALTECAALLEGFGGHSGAAGFSMHSELIPQLRTRLSRAVSDQTEGSLEPTLTIDAYTELSDLTLDLVEEVDRLAPFGPGNPSLVFAARSLRVVSHAILGRSGEHSRVVVEDEQERRQTVFWWQGAGRPLPQGRFDLAFTLQASDYRGVKEVQVGWLDARQREPSVVEVRQEPAYAVIDHRTDLRPEALIKSLLEEDEIQVWAEAHDLLGLEVRTRVDLVPCTKLVVWTLPPGPEELQEALSRVQPTEVLYFSSDPGLDEPAALLQRLAGLVKHALKARGGRLDLEAVAAALSQRVAAVRLGLEWFDATGKIRIEAEEREYWQISQGSGRPDLQAANDCMAKLAGVLAETAAYRDYVRQVPIAALASR